MSRTGPPPPSAFELEEERREMAAYRARVAQENRRAAKRLADLSRRTVEVSGPIELARLCRKGHPMYWDPKHDRWRCRDRRTSKRDAIPHLGEHCERRHGNCAGQSI